MTIRTNERVNFVHVPTYTGARIKKAIVNGLTIYMDRSGDMFTKVKGIMISVNLVIVGG